MTGGDEGKPTWNFSAGPCILPRPVLDCCARDMIDYKGTGQSVMEMSHRKPEYTDILKMTKEEVRRFLEVPDDYTVMLNQGGASNIYTAVVKNLIGLKPARKAMYMTTGLWSGQCIDEARKFIEPANLIEVTNLSRNGFTQLTDPKTWLIDPEASYLHMCGNETVHGFEITEDNFPWDIFPEDMVIVSDMSSNIGTRKINWKRFSCVYAGAQKNMGPAGANVVILKKSLLGKAQRDTPFLCDWTMFEAAPQAQLNTPPCWSIYVMGLNVSYMNQNGGLPTYDAKAEKLSSMIYDVIDQSGGYYVAKVDKKMRSRINIVFRICHSPAFEQRLIVNAQYRKIINIRGHIANPGFRVSIYNAMPEAGVVALCEYLRDF